MGLYGGPRKGAVYVERGASVAPGLLLGLGVSGCGLGFQTSGFRGRVSDSGFWESGFGLIWVIWRERDEFVSNRSEVAGFNHKMIFDHEMFFLCEGRDADQQRCAG